jgi:hypothetical protein
VRLGFVAIYFELILVSGGFGLRTDATPDLGQPSLTKQEFKEVRALGIHSASVRKWFFHKWYFSRRREAPGVF